MTASDSARPGLAKTHGERLVRRVVTTWLAGSDGRFRAMFEEADVVNEGSIRAHDGGVAWFGSTSLILPWPPSVADSVARAFVVAVAARDPHVRLRAMRVATREASLRAPGRLGRAECEIAVAATDDGLRIDVDIQAPLYLPNDVGLSGKTPGG